MIKTILTLTLLTTTIATQAAQFEGSISEWKYGNDSFPKSEETFKKAMQLLRTKYYDKNINEEDLYRAATEGMLAALNDGKENFNTILSPRDMEDTNIQISGQIQGIGVTMDFDDNTKNAKVRAVIDGSAAQKAGIKRFDQILSVDGKRFKGLKSMVTSIRGKAGESVRLKILREDKVLDIKVTRAAIKIPLVVATPVDKTTGYLHISSFTTELAKDLETQLSVFKDLKLSKLILDLRGNMGGVFESGVATADLFLKSGDIIVKTKSRDGKIKEYKATGTPWSPQTKIIVLTDVETSSSAEFLAATLKENRQAILIGTNTGGKWTAESLERLPNDYFIKYSVMAFLSPSGKSYQSVGLTPNFEISKSVSGDNIGYDFIKNMPEHIAKDPALKAAVELPL